MADPGEHTDPLRIDPVQRDLGGGFTVRRLLPSPLRAAVGPFVFFDHFGPITAGPGDNHDVRPHPHIGLSTVTYLFEGAMQHRDSTGVVQRIEPGAINWMTAGRGIVHSERTPDDLRSVERVSHGLQLWVALPEVDEAIDASFAHTPAAAIPVLEVGGATVRVLVGAAFGATSPVVARSPALYLDIRLTSGDALPLPLAEERAIYVVSGDVTLEGARLPPQTMHVLARGDEPMLACAEAGQGEARVVLIGGDPLGSRTVWWNFVASQNERIVKAADDWAAGRFDAVPGETEFIPLPERPLPRG
ncbi:MAG: pirin family protein [Pseudomonadota bacterium]|nr:pirin family protein [Pseudomonadota bacterium]